MSTNTKNQTNRILRYLRTGRGLTAISALTRFGCMRLAARIEEMRQEGIKVRSRTLRRNGKRFALATRSDLFGRGHRAAAQT
jgi:hypothetical protein